MIIQKASFVGSFVKVESCPHTGLPEFAFIGRSNVGKSSLINMLCRRKRLAKTSSTPGKTLQINYFLINDALYLVDLPGYGFARIPKKDRIRISLLARNYLETRRELRTVFLLLDLRIPRQESDKQFMEWLALKKIPFVLVFTKSDKCTTTERSRNLSAYQQAMLNEWEDLPRMIVTSAKTGAGRGEMLSLINEIAEFQA